MVTLSLSLFSCSETGRGDTIDRLGNLHLLLSDFSHHQRVLAAAQVAPQLVRYIQHLTISAGSQAKALSVSSRMFFKVVLHGGDMELVSQLVPILVERTVLLFNIPSFQTEMRKYELSLSPPFSLSLSLPLSYPIHHSLQGHSRTVAGHILPLPPISGRLLPRHRRVPPDIAQPDAGWGTLLRSSSM